MYAQHPGSGYTIWLTGMQGAGKRTLAREVAARLQRMGKPVELLDAPEWAPFVTMGPGETREERDALVRRIGFIARALTRAGGFVIVPAVSPTREVREAVRREIGRFLEVFVDCPIETLMERDRSGQYQKAMRGEIRNFIGVTDPYEPPASPEVTYDSSRSTVDEGAGAVVEALVREGAIVPGDAGMDKRPRRPRAPKAKAPPPPPRLVSPLPARGAKPAAKPAAPAKPAAKVPVAKGVPVAKAPAGKAPAAKAPAAKAPAKAPPLKVVKSAKPSAPAKPAARKPEPAKKPAARAPAVKAAPKKVAAKTARASGGAKKSRR